MKPNEKWTTGVSQVSCPFGKACLSPILNMFGMDIVAWDLSLSPNFEQTNRMPGEVFEKNPNLEGLVFHGDQSWQYQMRRYGERLKEKGDRPINVPQRQPHRQLHNEDFLRHTEKGDFLRP